MSSNLIPIFQMADYYVYFKDLLNTEHNAPWIGLQKRALYHKAVDQVSLISNNLSAEENIKQAINFLHTVAANERDKEIAAVRNYCQKLHKKYPSFIKDKMTADDILKNPDKFYKDLTIYLNKAKQGADKYKQELMRIRENAGLVEKTWKKKKRNEYSDDNFLYNLQNDLQSLLTKLNKTFNGRDNSIDAYTNKVQAAVMRIINKYNIQNHVAKGEDFAAIAAAVLIDIQQHLQDEFDEKRKTQQIQHNEKIADVMASELDKMVDKYILEIEKGQNLSSVQEALKDITSIRGNHIIQEMKKGLGIKSLTTVSALAERTSQIQQIENKTKYRKKAYNQMIHNVIGDITNPNLLATLPRLTFTKFDKRSGHGNISEVVSSVLQYNKNLGFFVKSNVGVDLMEFHIDYKLEDSTTASIIKVMNKIDKAFTAFEKATHSNEDSSLRDLGPAIHSLNVALQKSNQELDTLLNNIAEEEQFFVYHDSEKLQSSVETGKSLGFKGRDHLNILSGIDSIFSAMQSAGINMPNTKEELHFLALNIADSSVGGDININGQSARDSLATYLSKFVGLLMFDDVENMAREAYNKIEYTNLNVIHVYKLNKIYVPASMLLIYISDEIEKASQFALEDIAKIDIDTKNANQSINTWLDKYHSGEIEYNLEEWRKVANEVSSKTQIKITLLAAFLKFIDNLWNEKIS